MDEALYTHALTCARRLARAGGVVEPEDLAQETCLRLLRQRDPAAFANPAGVTWLTRATFLDMVKRPQSRAHARLGEWRAARDDTAGTALARVELADVLATLAGTVGGVATVAAALGYPMATIAAATGVPLGTALTRIHRCRRQLAEEAP